jgi:membrane-associated protease RseP (regulator of RpoE activity)
MVIGTGQTPGAGKATLPSLASGTEKLRDIPFPAGINLQFLIKELARDIDLSVVFDTESRLEYRTVKIELMNVTVPAALEYIRVQERLIYERIGPKTLLVASEQRATSIPQFGVGVAPLTPELAQYFGVAGGLLVNSVQADSPARQAGLKVGDVIVEIDGVPVRGALGAVRTIVDRKGSDVILRFVRDRKSQTITLTPEDVIKP